MSLFVSGSIQGTAQATFPPTLSIPTAPRHLRHGGLAPHGLALMLAAMLVGGIVALAAAVAVAAEAPLGTAPGTPAGAPASSGSAGVAGPGAQVVVRRFALITGVSQGGPDRVPLRYAGTDAKAVQRVLSDLGGVSQSTLLLDSGRAELRRAFDKLDQQIAAARAPGQRTEMIFYYSGHSDENGLLLGPDRVTYAELRAWVEQTKADVRIAVLDSCASGALTRIKGGVHQAPFLVDTSSAARGHAYLTASSENEVAQESDRIGAAYFTHYLVSGLRGAADVSHDGRVTLSEAYQYAFTETLARTETSKGGPQHASYDFQLSGKGDLVMTDLHATSARLVLPPEMTGRLFVRDAQGRFDRRGPQAAVAAHRAGPAARAVSRRARRRSPPFGGAHRAGGGQAHVVVDRAAGRAGPDRVRAPRAR